ncbi:MAG: aminotransferase class V-fold PLP-dependent enzyme, partial [Treponema sp.]|uniref:aminotransferase class V-fold PLP-dependent enzyme n=1 Tax=Treponema sp. TaxID=166 RepID=UPI00360D8CFF
VQDIAQALKAHTAGKRPVHFHVDMVQSIGKLPVAELGLADVHSASMSAHKIGGPRGIGLLYLKQPLNSGIRGGSQERNIRPGTENLAGACALARCLEKTYTDFQQKFERAGELSRFLIGALCRIPECSIIPSARIPVEISNAAVPDNIKCAHAFSPWIIQVSFKNVPAEIMTRCLSDRDIFVSAGSACSSKTKVRPILAALSVSPEIAQNAIRISIGHSTEKSDLEQFVAAVREIVTDFN